jgi:hypothetical protein
MAGMEGLGLGYDEASLQFLGRSMKKTNLREIQKYDVLVVWNRTGL